MLLGVDVGGTFTDAVLHRRRRRCTPRRRPAPPATSRAAVLRAVEAVLERAGAEAGPGRAVRPRDDGRHQRPADRGAARAPPSSPPAASPTCSTSAARTAPGLYHPCAPNPAPLVEPELRLGVGRAGRPRGRDRAARRGRARPPRRRGAAARRRRRSRSACCSPTSTPPTSGAIAERLRAALPGVHVSASHEVLPRFREYERCSTTVDRRLPVPAARPLPRAGSARRRASGGFPSRW